MFIYCICTQYLVGAPFALITASIRRGMEVISLWHCWGGMEAQVSLTVAFSSSAFFGLLSLIFLLTIPHRFSMGFRSGEFAGQQGRAETFGGAGPQSIKGAHGTRLLIGLCSLLICVSKWMLLYWYSSKCHDAGFFFFAPLNYSGMILLYYYCFCCCYCVYRVWWFCRCKHYCCCCRKKYSCLI